MNNSLRNTFFICKVQYTLNLNKILCKIINIFYYILTLTILIIDITFDSEREVYIFINDMVAIHCLYKIILCQYCWSTEQKSLRHKF